MILVCFSMTRNEGINMIEVDILEGVSDVHRKRTETLYERWKCGKRKNLRECGNDGSMISGIYVVQHKNCSFTRHMQWYAEEKSLGPLCQTQRNSMTII